jgi:uncharacterized protein (DUF58 family)
MSSLPANRLLDPDVIARAEMLGLKAREVVEGYMAGEHKSPFRGFAIEFAQHREYTHGDDVRHLDWKVLGRTDRAYIKQYEQDTNFIAHLYLDGSESMKYTSHTATKLEYGKMLAATLAYLILLQRDAVAVNIFDATVRETHQRTDNRSALLNILHTLAAYQPQAATDLAKVLHDMAGKIRRRGIVILISDLLDDEEQILSGLQHLRFAGHDVILFHVLDPAELEFPFRGTVEFIGLEYQPRIIARPAELRKTYLAEFEAYRNRLRDGCSKTKTHYVLANTGQPLAETLAGYLAFRLHTSRR